ncbi:MAG: tRNA (guanosine(46)-N(7))-methyltransferase TrmB, partial [Halocynthiibacter sp.]
MAEKLSPSGAPRRNFYGRRKGKGLRDSQREYLENDLTALTLANVDRHENPRRVPLDIGTIFDTRPVWLEVGFGGGEHMVHQAKLNPGVSFIGCEPYINGVAMLLGHIRKAGVNNIAIHPGDVRDLFDVLPDNSVARAFLLYPDPWPKSRHHRRRFVTPEHLQPLARVLKRDAIFRIATDSSDYVRQAMEEVPRHGFEWLAGAPSDWREPWEDWTPTRYEKKAISKSRASFYLS